jgi:hypothetical protein
MGIRRSAMSDPTASPIFESMLANTQPALSAEPAGGKAGDRRTRPEPSITGEQ